MSNILIVDDEKENCGLCRKNGVFYFVFLVNDESNILFLDLKHQCL